MERGKAFTRLPPEKAGKQFSFYKFRDQESNWDGTILYRFPCVILNSYRTVSQFVEFSCIEIGGSFFQIAVWIKELDSSLNTSRMFPYQENLTFPSSTKGLYNFVLSSQESSRF